MLNKTGKCWQTCLTKRNFLGMRCFSVKVKKDTFKKYTDTINLPKTEFKVWIQPPKRSDWDKHIQKVCNFSELYSWQRKFGNSEEYILHDGPPYANGVPHMGHAINKILKDITIRYKLLQGYKVHYKPGWDCHGLPIELLAVLNLDKANNKLSPVDIREKARKFATNAINNQQAVFKSWAVMGDWSNDGCYFTFDKDYIKNEFVQFYNLYKKGLVYRDFKPVYWSPSSKTALAEAELEYNSEHISTAVTIAVRLSGFQNNLNTVFKKNCDTDNNSLYALLWTTTPWTLPANQAIAYNPLLDYSVIKINGSDGKYLLATKLIEQFSKLTGRCVDIINSVSADDLSSIKYEHPLNFKNEILPLLPSSHVTADKGTGLVHIAAAHGQDDFIIGKKNGFKIESIVDEDGNYTNAAGKGLVGLNVLSEECSNKVLKLINSECILSVDKFKHSYPYDWRTKKPVILRASEQWFLDTDNIKQDAINELKDVKIVPDRNSSGFLSLLERRPYWCISRQRVWGVPIPVVYNKLNDTPIITGSLIEHYCRLLDSHGINFWWELPLSHIIPENICNELNLDIKDVEKGQDILDIWLDSGLSWSYVLDDNQIADMYLEGVDQLTGWFQSSLITSVALRGKAPYKTIFVHGYAVDDKGHKMSKSIGNVINPQDIVYGGPDRKKQPPYGIDVLRWWVAGHATQHVNVPVSNALLSDSQQCVQKLRSVLRFLLGATFDIEHISNEKSVTLHAIDKYILHLLYFFNQEVYNLYNSYQYNRVCALIINFITNEISAKYLTIIKDRLYCDDKNSNGRRAVQLTINNILNVLLHVIAPIAPVLAEEAYLYHPMNQAKETLFQSNHSVCQESWIQPDVEEQIKLALDVKKTVIKESPININHWNLSAVISASPECYNVLKLSSVTLLEDSYLISDRNSNQYMYNVNIKSVKSDLCERCRIRVATVQDADSNICKRCSNVLSSVRSNSDHKTSYVI
ncbi:isoleucyl-tRNA synthetase, mitochondrial isoform X2 [Lycorma delicatula]|uniref:isoleucyl-tRNA synthetase, mitochondrial isoform X2 n=1 Tax=Lycorma delicatula TaxID=130591 RepID=UPI003F50FB56